MTAATSELSLLFRRMYSEATGPFVRAKKLRVIQLGSYPALNRGARTNLLTIHERLLTRGHQSIVVDLTGYRRVKQPGVYAPRSTFELMRLLLDTPADVVHLHIGSALTLPKLALAALVNRLPEVKTVCTMHLGGHFYPKKGLRARCWGATGLIMRQFDTLVAINPEIASFFERLGVAAKRVHLITPFPRLRMAESLTLSSEIETFCRRHTPLIASVTEFEPGSNLPLQFDILNKVRERYPSAGLIAIGGGTLHLKYMQERALHRDCNHIELTGDLSPAATAELIRRANVLLRTGYSDGDSFSIQEALKAGTPLVSIHGRRRGAGGIGELEAGALQVLRSLQIARPQYEDAPPALIDGADDLIRLYKQITARPVEATPLPTGYEWPSIGWGL
jgi:glycosyltransferase involved in cell wall biosynthesis